MMKHLWDTGAAQPDLAHVHWGSLLMARKTAWASYPVTVIYNSSAVYSVPTFLSAASNGIRAKLHGDNAGTITVGSQPFVNTVQEQSQEDQFWYIMVTIIIMIAFAFVPSAVVAFPVMEAEAHHNSRHQQYISGVSIPAYWLSNYTWDIFIYMWLIVISACALQYYNVKVFTEQDCDDSQFLQLFLMQSPSTPDPYDWPHQTVPHVVGNVTYTTPLPTTCADLKNDANIGCDKDLHELNPGVPGGTLFQLNMGAPEESYVYKFCPVTCKRCGMQPFWVVLLLFTGYGMSIIAATYLFSFAFSRHTVAQLFTLLVNVILGLILVLTSYILNLIGIIDADVKEWSDRLIPFFRLSPGFCLGNGIFNIATKFINDFAGLAMSPPRIYGASLLQWDVAGADLVYLFVGTFVYLGLVMFVDYLRNFPALINKIPGLAEAQTEEVEDYDIDADVKAEQERVMASPIPTGLPGDDVIHIRKLRKVYGGSDATKWLFFGIGFLVTFVLTLIYCPAEWAYTTQSAFSIFLGVLVGGALFFVGLFYKRQREVRGLHNKNAKVAVRSLTIGLPKGDCFGFLGINGAGKTSTLNILTGAQLPTSGEAWLGSKNIMTEQKDVRRLIGYCPQHDALLNR